MFSCKFASGARRDDTGTGGGGTGPEPGTDEMSGRASARYGGSDKRVNAECGGTGGGR